MEGTRQDCKILILFGNVFYRYLQTWNYTTFKFKHEFYFSLMRFKQTV